MNWSTRLRRWVRIRPRRFATPRRTRARRPSCPSRWRARTRSGGLPPDPRAPRRRSRRPAPPSPGAPPRPAPASRPPRRPLRPRSPSPLSSSSATAGVAPSSASSVSEGPAPFRAVGGRVLELGGQRGEGAGEHVDLVLRQLGAVGQEHRLGVEQPFEPEQQRVPAPPLRRGGLAAGVELGQRGVDRAAAGGPGSEVVERLAVEQDRLARELAHTRFELIARDRAGRVRCDFDGFGHERQLSERLALARMAAGAL